MSIEHSILAVLSFWPSSGYDIKSEFEHEAASLYWGASYGSIYPKLKKLEEEGYIYPLQEDEEGRKKKLYELTTKGWTELEKWLYTTPSYPVIKDELFIKMSSWHEDLDQDILIEHLTNRKKQTEQILQFVKEWPNNGYSFINKMGMLAINYSKMRLEMEVAWIDQTIQILLNNDLPVPQDVNGVIPKMKLRRNKAMKSREEIRDESRNL